MSFLAVLFALLLEQARPLTDGNWIHATMRGWVRWVKKSLDAGQPHHGVLVWSAAVVLPTLVAAGVHLLLWSYSVVLTFVWSVAMLYVTLGFRQFSHHFTEVRGALERGDDDAVRQSLADWRRVPVQAIAPGDLLRQIIDHSVLAVHRHVLGVLVCFMVFWVLGLGPAGAVLFRLADYFASSNAARCNRQDAPGEWMPSESVCSLAASAWRVINHVPARASAIAFAIVGNFEEAIANWRTLTPSAKDPNDAIVLVSAAGALNLSLPGDNPPEGATTARAPEPAHLASLVGLVWRSVVLWMLLLALLTLAHSVG
ncbi:MAG TPA: cobalamin biosynthesis protein [Burkholderiaceae bacterium]|nr:cobalamin biosynthesis protein [Burkholderiaceae bacterium]